MVLVLPHAAYGPFQSLTPVPFFSLQPSCPLPQQPTVPIPSLPCLTLQDGEGASSAAAAQRLVMMGGRLAWQLRCWVAELGSSGGYNTLMEVGGWGLATADVTAGSQCVARQQ